VTNTAPPAATRAPWPVALATAFILAMGAAFHQSEDGGRFRPNPYYDGVGMLTACGGLTNASTRIIGHKIVEGATYTPELCQRLFFEMAGWYNARLRECVVVPVFPREVFAYLHLAWNIGVPAFCNSTLVRKLNRQNYAGACDEILRWVFTKSGNCNVRANNCWGIVLRRRIEHTFCTGTLPIPGLS